MHSFAFENTQSSVVLYINNPTEDIIFSDWAAGSGCEILYLYTAGYRHLPVERRVLLQNVHVNVLLYETVEQDGQRCEADVIQSQVGCIVQRLERRERLSPFFYYSSWQCILCSCVSALVYVYLPAAKSHRRTGRGTGGRWSRHSGKRNEKRKAGQSL